MRKPQYGNLNSYSLGGGTFKGLIDASLSLFDGWWFVADYVILMLMSPFLNAGLERISRKALMFIILMLSFMMYGVWWFHAKDGSMPLLLFKTYRAVESPCCVTDKNAFGSSPDSVRCSSDCEHDSKTMLANSKKGLDFILLIN